MNTSFAKLAVPTQGTAILVMPEGGKLGPIAAKLDKLTRGTLSRGMKAAEFTGKREKTLTIVAPAGTKLDRVILVGLGGTKSFDTNAAERIGAGIYEAVSRDATATIVLEGLDGDAGALAAHLAAGLRLKSYRFSKYRTKEDKDAKPKLKSVVVQTDAPNDAKKRHASLDGLVDGIFFTRDLVTEPPNIIYPESFVARAKELAKDGIKVEALGEAAMKKLGMGALLGVGQGSSRESQLLVMRWDGAKDKSAAPVAIVGKGVTFDTGGISLKPPAGMWDMKWDMGGAGVVVGLMRALARRKAPVNVIGLCGLVENMPDGNAQRPGDVVTSMSGQTIEVLNTDAEGRLVLADVLWYAQQRFKPKVIVDLATLTGAIIAALAAFLPWELGKKADPFAPVPPGIRPEWYFVAMFHTLKLIPGHVLGIEGEVLGILGFGVVALVLIAIPFLDRRALRGERNPVFTAMAWLGIAYLVVFTIVGYLAE